MLIRGKWNFKAVVDIVTGGVFKLAGTEVTATAAELNILDGATATVAELNALHGAPLGATIVVGDEAANVINVAIQLEDADGVALAIRGSILAYLSDDANGDSVVATEPDGGIAIGTDGLLVPLLTGSAGSEVAASIFQLTSEADGDIDIDITESGTDTFYLILVMPNGKLIASGAITFAA